jgi:ACR3 family arsenite efflux pump ArsB
MNCSIDIARLIFGLSSGAALVEVPVLISLANVAFWFQWWYFASGVERPKAMWVGR